MSVSLFASSALGSIGKELDNGKQTCKALFPTDAIMAGNGINNLSTSDELSWPEVDRK